MSNIRKRWNMWAADKAAKKAVREGAVVVDPAPKTPKKEEAPKVKKGLFDKILRK